MVTTDERMDYRKVEEYWTRAGAHGALAGYGGVNAGLPQDSVRYRLKKERAVINRWLENVPSGANVLDAGCGAGLWTNEFALRFGAVTGVELSDTMYGHAKELLADQENVTLIKGSVIEHIPEHPLGLVFMGGILMYLNRDDAVDYLRKLKDRLIPGGIIIARETTVRKSKDIRTGDYQVAYRTNADYQEILSEAGLKVRDVKRNTGYNRMAWACSLSWGLRQLPGLRSVRNTKVGKPVWWTLRALTPLTFYGLPGMFRALRIPWPYLENHFYLAGRLDD